LTILFDNYSGLPGLATLWGLSALIETGERTILFDTGSNGRVLLKNMAALGLTVESLDLVFLSHPHWDHVGGLDSVLEADGDVTVVLHEGFSEHLILDLGALCRDVIVVGSEPQQLAPGVFSTGTLASQPPEQAMVLELDGVTAAISGCAHPGMERIVERGVSVLGKRIHWAIGGFHLMHSGSAEVAHSIRALQDLGVTDVVPTHCTGDAAKAAFERAYDEHCHAGGVGRVVHLSPPRQL
jgi:7,8-dihydropterin-6-yl-methyl-4-(beta-D-ribofuranosyl)aminobenzene 5'-phosphate synthase